MYRDKVRGVVWGAYYNAKRRCTIPTDPYYHRYGGRGIRFLFESFEEFYRELGPRPTPQHSLDRIDNNGDYVSGNIRWATKSEQARDNIKNFGDPRAAGIKGAAVRNARLSPEQRTELSRHAALSKNKAAQELGSRGGRARAATLSPEERKRIATMGGKARQMIQRVGKCEICGQERKLFLDNPIDPPTCRSCLELAKNRTNEAVGESEAIQVDPIPENAPTAIVDDSEAIVTACEECGATAELFLVVTPDGAERVCEACKAYF